MKIGLIPSGWSAVELDDLRAKGRFTLVGGPFGSDLTRTDYIDQPGIPVIRGTNLGGNAGRFIDDGFVYVSEEKANQLELQKQYEGIAARVEDIQRRQASADCENLFMALVQQAFRGEL